MRGTADEIQAIFCQLSPWKNTYISVPRLFIPLAHFFTRAKPVCIQNFSSYTLKLWEEFEVKDGWTNSS